MTLKANKRLDVAMMQRGIVASRSQAESYIKLGSVSVNGQKITKSGHLVRDSDQIILSRQAQYVSRAGLKLESVAQDFDLDFNNKIVLDVGSSTGGFTDYALKNGARKVIAVDVGTNQLHPDLRSNPSIELHEQTDIRTIKKLDPKPDVVVIDVSFISLREILPSISKLVTRNSIIVAMAKPQFEARMSSFKHKGIIKNESMRREILKGFELWCREYFVLDNKKDSAVSGEKGNTERFYKMRKKQVY